MSDRFPKILAVFAALASDTLLVYADAIDQSPETVSDIFRGLSRAYENFVDNIQATEGE